MDHCKRDNRLGLCAAFGLPLGAALCLGLLSFDSDIYGHIRLRWSLWGAGLLLLVWQGWLCAAGRKPTIGLRVVKAHYVQALIQLCIYLYWGWYWPPVYEMAQLIAAQIAFAYGFDALLCWSRRQEWHLGFRPFPIVLSMNLFIWFKFDWFALQLLMVATSLVGKEFFTWCRNGRSTHIFNPSGFALTAFSIALLATGNTDLTCGEAIAKTLAEPEYIYVVVFALGLVVQCLFSVVLMTLAAVARPVCIKLYLWCLFWLFVLRGHQHSHWNFHRAAPADDRSGDFTQVGFGAVDLRRTVRHLRLRAIRTAWLAGAADVLRQAPLPALAQLGGSRLRPLPLACSGTFAACPESQRSSDRRVDGVFLFSPLDEFHRQKKPRGAGVLARGRGAWRFRARRRLEPKRRRSA